MGKRAFTASALASEAGIQATIGDDGFPISTALDIASAWLGKMVRWGYVLRAGSEPSTGGKGWARLYILTSFGVNRRPPKASSTSKGRRGKSKA